MCTYYCADLLECICALGYGLRNAEDISILIFISFLNIRFYGGLCDILNKLSALHTLWNHIVRMQRLPW
jgi:hypothetical protein